METWQDCANRELQEETGLTLLATGWRPVHFASNSPVPDCLLAFGSYSDVISSNRILKECQLTPETSEIGLVFGTYGLGDIICFRSHVEAIDKYFRDSFPAKGQSFPHYYTKLV